MTHPHDMTTWAEIACQRGHETHSSVLTEINLANEHGYRDLPQIPAQLVRRFKMWVWDPEVHPVDGGPYCPAHDAVSETILSDHIWEPRETILALHVLRSSVPGLFLDFGAQIGWFSLLAASCDRTVYAYDADEANLSLLTASAEINDFSSLIHPRRARIGVDDLTGFISPIRLAKIDLEGAENKAIELLTGSLADGSLDHLLMEVSPVFADYYPSLVAQIISYDYDCFMLPPKSTPPSPLTPPAFTLEPYRLTRSAALSIVPSLHQEDFWFKRKDAEW